MRRAISTAASASGIGSQFPGGQFAFAVLGRLSFVAASGAGQCSFLIEQVNDLTHVLGILSVFLTPQVRALRVMVHRVMLGRAGSLCK